MRHYGAIIIGDEIMRGKRVDRHFSHLVAILAAPQRRLHLSWARYLGDDRERLSDTLRASFASGDVVFCFGGIGVTPDDHTRQAAAAALGEPLELHPEAEREIRNRMQQSQQPLTPERLELGHFPRGSRIIPNPFNRIPGFSFADHHFLPGFPQMAWPMAEWVLDHYYADDYCGATDAEASLLVWRGLESQLLTLMKRVETQFPDIKVFSLPSFGDATRPQHIELGARGAAPAVAAAINELRAGVIAAGFECEDNPPPTPAEDKAQEGASKPPQPGDQ